MGIHYESQVTNIQLMHKVFLGIGGNIGDKRQNFIKAESLIAARLGKIIRKSSVYETPPWGFQTENLFWNSVVVIETGFSPDELLMKIHEIEGLFFREPKEDRYSSREMDIDILYFDDIFLETESLIIPHPRMHQRKFVLVPLVEIAPEFKHPLLRLTSLQMLENCRDESIIIKVDF